MTKNTSDQTAPGDLPALSPGELAIIKDLAAGLRLPEIALKLGVHRGTVATQSVRAYRKLGVSTAHQAVVEARRLGLIEL